MTLQSLEQVRAFVEGSEAVDFAGGNREGVCTLVRRAWTVFGDPRFECRISRWAGRWRFSAGLLR